MSSYTIPKEYGQVLQYQGPFDPGDSISFQEGQHNVLCKIGISIGEKDYMSFTGIDRENFESIPVKLI